MKQPDAFEVAVEKIYDKHIGCYCKGCLGPQFAKLLRAQLEAQTKRAERLQAEVNRLLDERERPCKGCGL